MGDKSQTEVLKFQKTETKELIQHSPNIFLLQSVLLHLFCMHCIQKDVLKGKFGLYILLFYLKPLRGDPLLQNIVCSASSGTLYRLFASFVTPSSLLPALLQTF